MRGSASDVPGRFVVLSVVTAPDDDAVAAGGPPVSDGTRRGSPVVAITAAAMLSFSRFGDGRLRRPVLRSVDAIAIGEAEALTIVDRHLGRHYLLGATLVVFGTAATLGTLGRRARRHWLFEEFDFPRWSGGGVDAKFDAASDWQPADTLAEACAATGIKGATALAETSSATGAVDPAAETVPTHVRRAEASAVAIALLMAHDLSAAARSPVPLLKTWWDLLCLVRASLPRLEHCASFRCDGLVDPDIYSIVGAPLPRGPGPRR